MMEENKLIPVEKEEASVVVTDDGEMLNGLFSTEMSICSLDANTPAEKARLYNVINSPDGRIADLVNTTYTITDIYCEIVTCTRDDGTSSRCPRVVLIAADGKGYQAVSTGIFSALKKIIRVYGPPHWEGGIPITFKQLNRGDKRILTLEVNEKELLKAEKK